MNCLRHWWNACVRPAPQTDPAADLIIGGGLDLRVTVVSSLPPPPPSPSPEPPPPSPPPSSGGKDQQMLGNFAGVDVTCSEAGVFYLACEVPLTELVPNMRFGIRASFGWTALASGIERRMTIAYGKTFDEAMAGSTSSKTGRTILNRVVDDGANLSNFSVFLDLGMNVDQQRLQQASYGDETTGTGSTPPTGAVQLSGNDCSIFIGVKSGDAGDVIHVDGIEVWRTHAL